MVGPFLGISAATALKVGGGLSFPSLDAAGNVKVAGATQPALTPALTAAPLNLDAAGNVKTVESHGYETVAASQTAQVMGGVGAIGDVLNTLVIVPGTSAAGAVSILDGAVSITVFAGGGVTALADLKPIVLRLDMISATGPWKVTTGANVTAVGIGQFSA